MIDRKTTNDYDIVQKRLQVLTKDGVEVMEESVTGVYLKPKSFCHWTNKHGVGPVNHLLSLYCTVSFYNMKPVWASL